MQPIENAGEQRTGPVAGKTLRRRAATVLGLASAIVASTVVAGGGGGPGSYGDNPNHEKGSMSGDVARDCTNFRVTDAGQVTADCNTSSDSGVDPSSTTIDIGDYVHVQNERQSSVLHHTLPLADKRWCKIWRPVGFLITWANGNDHVSRPPRRDGYPGPLPSWKDTFRDSCTEASIAYEGGNVYLDARCTLTEQLERDHNLDNVNPCLGVTANQHAASLRTRLNNPERDGGLLNSNGQLALK